jgi:hypothetical protein
MTRQEYQSLKPGDKIFFGSKSRECYRLVQKPVKGVHGLFDRGGWLCRAVHISYHVRKDLSDGHYPGGFYHWFESTLMAASLFRGPDADDDSDEMEDLEVI